MGVCFIDRKKRKFGFENTFENSFVIPESFSEAIYNSIGRIELEIDGNNKISTGFFMKIKNYNFFLTCHHSIEEKNVNLKKNINIFYGKSKNETKKTIELNKDKRFIKCFKELDVILIEILKNDNINEEKYLFPDLNYKNDLSHYIDIPIYTAGYPNVNIYNKERHISSGKIEKIENGIIYHNCDTRKGSSGSPLIDIYKLVIGIHYGGDKKINYGTFIGRIIDKLNLEEKEERIKILNINQNKEKNYSKIINDKHKKIDFKINENKKNEKLNIINETQKNSLQNSNIKSNNSNKSFIKEKDPNKSQDFGNFLSNISGMEGISPQLFAEIIKNPYLMNIVKSFYSNPNLINEFSKIPQVNELKEKNPILKVGLENPELVNQLLTPSYMNIIAQMLSGGGNNNMNNNKSENGNKKKDFKIDNEEDKKDENDFLNKEFHIEDINMNKKNNYYDEYKEYLILLKSMGFTDENLNLDLLIDCDGNFEKTLNLLINLNQI